MQVNGQSSNLPYPFINLKIQNNSTLESATDTEIECVYEKSNPFLNHAKCALFSRWTCNGASNWFNLGWKFRSWLQHSFQIGVVEEVDSFINHSDKNNGVKGKVAEE